MEVSDNFAWEGTSAYSLSLSYLSSYMQPGMCIRWLTLEQPFWSKRQPCEWKLLVESTRQNGPGSMRGSVKQSSPIKPTLPTSGYLYERNKLLSCSSYYCCRSLF